MDEVAGVVAGVGRALRTLYVPAPGEPLPDRWRALIAELEEMEKRQATAMQPQQ